MTGIRTRGPGTVVLLLRRAAPELSWFLAHPQAAILPAGAPTPGSAPPSSIEGLGPYRLVSYDPERSITLARSDTWAADPVRAAFVDRIEANIGSDPAAAAREIASGRTDLLLDDGPPDQGRVAVPDGARVVRTPSGCIRYLFVNRRAQPFQRRDARLAVAHAVQRGRLTDPAASVRAGGLLPVTVVGHRDAPSVPPSARAGRAALARAGLAAGFSTELVVADAPRDRREARVLRRSLGRIGIMVRVRHVPAGLVHPFHYERPRARVPMGIATWCADWPGLAGRNVLGRIADPRAVRDVAPNPVYAHLRSSAVARALDEAAAASGDTAAEAWAAADATVQRTGGLVPLYEPLELVIISTRLRGFPAGSMWPRGDPTGLWIDPAVGPIGG